MKKHEKAFGEIKNYYNDITHNNLDLIRSLKEEVHLPTPPHTSPHLPTPPCISLHLPTPPHTSLHLPASPHTSLHPPTPPCISLHLPASPCISQVSEMKKKEVSNEKLMFEIAQEI